MDLLEKFDSVEARPDTRISEADRAFCEAHQAAYENAAATLQELWYFWDDMLGQQRQLLAPTDAAPTAYLLSHGSLAVSGDAILGQVRSLHALFIGHLVHYFGSTYHISISSSGVEENLLPQKPPDKQTGNYKELAIKYNHALQGLTLHYSDILEQLFLQTGGHAFAEQALLELKRNCSQGAWNISQKRADYARKKCTIQFTHYACHFNGCYSTVGSWEFSAGMKDILKGIAHFETGGFSSMPPPLARLINGHYLDSSDYDLPGFRKVLSLKMFKNGRVDIRFATETLAAQFTDEYLGTVCPCAA